MSKEEPTLADAYAPILNEKAVARLRDYARSMIAMGDTPERMDGQALNMLLDRHERNRDVFKILKGAKAK